MKLFWVCLLLLGMSHPAWGASGFEVQRISYGGDWREAGGYSSSGAPPVSQWLGVTSEGDWDWLALDVNLKTYLLPSDYYYSSLQTRWAFPRLSPKFKTILEYRWNDNYRIFQTGLAYSRTVFSGMVWELGCSAGSREGVIPEKNLYRYTFDEEAVRMTLDWEKWTAGLRVKRSARDYPETSRYSSTKWDLEERLRWTSGSGYQLYLVYREAVGYYPQGSLSSEYWRNSWGFSGMQFKWLGGRFDFNYRQSEWERGLAPYRNDRTLELRWTRSGGWLSNRIKLGLAERNFYFRDDYLDPDEPEEYPEDDPRSRRTIMASWESWYDWKPLRLEWELFWRVDDYYADIAADEAGAGAILAIVWEHGPYDFRAELAPQGNLFSARAHYRLRCNYHLN